MFKPGDILLYQATANKLSNIIPKCIQLITGNKVTHVSLYLGTSYGSHIILDALANGILIKTFTESELHNRKDGFNLYGIASLDVDIDVSKILLEASNYSRKPYGFVTIFNLFLQHGKTRIFPKKQWTAWCKSRNGHICSEVSQLVLENVLLQNNIKPPFVKPANLTEPDDYLVAPWRVLDL